MTGGKGKVASTCDVDEIFRLLAFFLSGREAGTSEGVSVALNPFCQRSPGTSEPGRQALPSVFDILLPHHRSTRRQSTPTHGEFKLSY